MIRNWTQKLIAGLSFTSVLFVFQACYGTPQDDGIDILAEGLVKSKTTGLPIEGIKVSNIRFQQYAFTGADGKFSFYTLSDGNLSLRFEDVDFFKNGYFQSHDTILDSKSGSIYVNIALEDK